MLPSRGAPCRVCGASRARLLLSGCFRPRPPESPLAVTPGAGVVDVSFRHTDPLDGQPLGEYRFALYRVVPGTPPEASPVGAEVEASMARLADGTYSIQDAAAPAGTMYVVEVVDPVGRRGPRVVVGTV